MAKSKTLHISAINISLLEHSKQAYIDLFNKIFRFKTEIRLRGQYHTIPNCILPNINEDFIVGSLYRYTLVDSKKPWIDTKEVKILVDEDKNPIPQTEPHLAPNSVKIDFVFSIKNHRLFFINEQISPNAMNDFFNKTFERLGISSEISATIEQSLEAIDEILRLPYISSLNIFINIPNPDDMDGIDQELERRLRNMGATSLREELKSKKGELKPDNETKGLMKLATSNGHIIAKGTSENMDKIELSTEEKPMMHKMSYDKNKDIFIDTLLANSKVFLENILHKIIS